LLPEKFKPMLAASEKPDVNALVFPLYISPKLDGIRGICTEKGPYGRSLKPIANKKFFEKVASEPLLVGLDGEIMGGSKTDPKAMQNTTSAVNSKSKSADTIEFHVFDRWDMPNAPYSLRYATLVEQAASLPPWVHVVEHDLVHNLDEMYAKAQEHLALGYEGSMLNDPNALYRCGRSTLLEAVLLKLKPMEDAEAIVVGFNELEHNDNEAKTNELGRTARSSAKAGKRKGDTLGSLQCKCDLFPNTFGLAGFTDDEKDEIWAKREQLMGARLTFKYQAHGSVNAPRIPIFKAWRPIGAE